MTTRKYTGKRYGPNGEYASKQERNISVHYPHLEYQPSVRVTYIQDHVYLPDWRLGRDSETGLVVYMEGKEWFTTDMCAKYEAIADSNPGMMLLIITPRITMRDMKRLDSHPRIEVILSNSVIPQRWLERTKSEPTNLAQQRDPNPRYSQHMQ